MSHGATFYVPFYGDSLVRKGIQRCVIHMYVCSFEFVVVTMTAYRCPLEQHFTCHLMVT